MEEQKFIEEHVKKTAPLHKQSALAWWEASTTGTKEAFERVKKAKNALNVVYANREDFAIIDKWRTSGRIDDPMLKRQIDVLYRQYLPKQVDRQILDRMVELEADVEEIFNTHRSSVGGKNLTENEIRKILGTSIDSAEVKAAWSAYHEVAPKIEKQLGELVNLRNRSARELGYANYYSLAMAVDEFSEEELLGLFDRLDEMTRQPFAAVKSEVDAFLAERFKIGAEELRPWHYQDLFFQEAPSIYDFDLDALFETVSLESAARSYYEGIGLEVADIMERGDLYEKPGKSPHAFCIDIDREGDVRILTNLVADSRWADTLLHELGHGVYDKYTDRKLPYLLREAAHTLTTEGVAMLFGRMAKKGEWLERVAGVPAHRADQAAEAARKLMRLEALVFSRWAQVMVRFEQAMYSNPDQNLSELWWSLKQKYQLLAPPDGRQAPDYAAKIHTVVAPVYYHNYMMGALFASQVHRYVCREVLGGADPFAGAYVGRPEAGVYFKEKIFGPGTSLHWNSMVREATGEDLTPRHFAEDYLE